METLERRESDRLPRDYWAAREVTERLCAHMGLADEEALLTRLGADLRYYRGPAALGAEGKAGEEGLHTDQWGVRRRTVAVERGGYRWAYRHAEASPLAQARTVSDIEGYAGWPDPARWDFSGAAEACRRHRGYAVVFAGDRLDRTAQLKPAMYLRGVEQILMDIAAAPRMAQAVFDRVAEYFLEYNRRVFEAAGDHIDIFMMGDDFGTQAGPLVGVDTWRRFFKRNFRRFTDLAHAHGIRVMHHTCGGVAPLIPEFIEGGLDILQSLQPRAAGMEPEGLKRRFGAHLAFHGGIDIQELLPRGTREDIRRDVARRARVLGQGGGYILCTAHNLLPDTPTENILALFEAYEEFGARA